MQRKISAANIAAVSFRYLLSNASFFYSEGGDIHRFIQYRAEAQG
jgi:hypothetical protein